MWKQKQKADKCAGRGASAWRQPGLLPCRLGAGGACQADSLPAASRAGGGHTYTRPSMEGRAQRRHLAPAGPQYFAGRRRLNFLARSRPGAVPGISTRVRRLPERAPPCLAPTCESRGRRRAAHAQCGTLLRSPAVCVRPSPGSCRPSERLSSRLIGRPSPCRLRR